MIIELCLLDVTAEVLQENIVWKLALLVYFYRCDAFMTSLPSDYRVYLFGGT